MAKIMIQGTGSSVGKSILVAALCRIFTQDGYKVCPYKSQNMSLNSYITLDGKEMGRAQVLQAYASGIEPEAYMNPILLKPTSDRKCQVIVNGKVFLNTDAKGYHNLKDEFKVMLKNDFEKIEENFDIVVMEGAGSPAEINLRENDIVNMGMAELVDAPVIIVGDIDKGGVFASLAGTLLLLSDSEKERVKGVIINKFRGDIDLLTPGIDMLTDIIHKPTLGVVPHFTLNLEDEDGFMASSIEREGRGDIGIAVIHLPHISNFTDIDALKVEEDVSVRFISKANDFGNPDLVILPGSKNTIDDLIYLRNSGLEEKLLEYSKLGRILGICGGYQMLGEEILDPHKVESENLSVKGIGIIPCITKLTTEKTMTRSEGITSLGDKVYGYEIHMGETIAKGEYNYFVNLTSSNGEETSINDGYISEDRKIMATYLHGVLDSSSFRETILNAIRREKGLIEKKSSKYEAIRDKEIDKLASIVRESIDIDSIYDIMGIKR